MRLLLDPNPLAGGGSAAAPNDLVNLVLAELDKRSAPATKPAETTAEPAKPAAAATEAKKPEPTSTEPDIRSWLKELEAKVNSREAAEVAKKETDERTQLRTKVAELITKGDLKSVEEVMDRFEKSFTAKVDEKDSKVKLVESRLAASAKKAALVESLTGIEFLNVAAAKDAIAKFDALFDVKLNADGEATVFEKGTNKPVGEAVKARLESGEFDHFLKSTARKGGTGNGATAQRSAQDSAPKDIVDWIAQGVEAQKAASLRSGLSTRTSLLQP